MWCYAEVLWLCVCFQVVLSHFLSASLLPVYDTSGAASDRNSVVLNDIHIDIMDYIVPASCTDTEFRQMWAEFEWENKVAVNTNISDLHEYLDHIIQCTNMKCLTPEKVKLLLVVFSCYWWSFLCQVYFFSLFLWIERCSFSVISHVWMSVWLLIF